MPKRVAGLFLLAAVSCFGQTHPGQQGISQFQTWKGTLKVARTFSSTNTVGPGGSPSTYSANTLLSLQLNLDKFDGTIWTGTATGTFSVDETLTAQIPGCNSVAHAKGTPAVNSSKFGMILDARSDTISFANFDAASASVPVNVTTMVSCAGTSTSPAGVLWFQFLPQQGLTISLTGSNLRGTGTLKASSVLGAFQLDNVFTWDLSGVSKNLELVVEPAGYTSWRPQANRDGSTPGNSIPVSATLRFSDGTSPVSDSDKAQKLTFELLETSKEPGVAINWPRDANDTDYDLKFAPANDLTFDDRTARQRAEKSAAGPPLTTATVTIQSFDWGGWTRLKVTADITDGRKIVGYLTGDKSQTEVRLPKRLASSMIRFNSIDFWIESSAKNSTLGTVRMDNFFIR